MDTIRDHLDAFLAEMVQRRKLRPNTIRAYRFDLQLAAAALPGPLETITLEAVETWLYAPPVATSTSNRRAASLGRFFIWAQRHGVCTVNPLLLHEPTPTPRRLPNPIRHTQHRSQLDAAIKAAPQPYRLIFTILRETGMRAGEVLGLTYDDVCLDPGRAGLRLRETKNGHPRTVILEAAATPQTIRGLRACLRKQGDLPSHVPLFRSNRDTGVSYRVLYYQWRQLSIAAGLVDADGDPLYTIHQLRHTRGTELIEQGRLIAQKEATGDMVSAAVLAEIAPVAWQHINFYGRYEFVTMPERIDLDALIAALAHHTYRPEGAITA